MDGKKRGKRYIRDIQTHKSKAKLKIPKETI